MKIQFLLISAGCLLTVSRAAYSSNQGSFNQLQAYNDHVPVIHNGVPVDTPEVQAAKAAHFEAYARAQALAAKQPSDGQYYEKTSSKGSTGVSFQNYQKQSFNSYYNQEQQYPGYTEGAAVFDNSGSLGGGYSSGGYSSGGFGSEYTGGFSGGHNQYRSYIPIDTPEVQHAKAAHFAAVAKAQSRPTNNHYRHKRGAFYYSQQEEQIPKIVNGVPEDTPEVQAAKVQHYIAHAEASNHADNDHSTSDSNLYEIYHKVNDGIHHIPILGKRGVPLDTPEVNSARAQHLLAHYYAHTKGSETWDHHGIYSEHVPIIGPNGVPFDTPEVQIAKAKHLLAHAKESAHHNQWAVSSGYGSSSGHSTSHY